MGRRLVKKSKGLRGGKQKEVQEKEKEEEQEQGEKQTWKEEERRWSKT